MNAVEKPAPENKVASAEKGPESRQSHRGNQKEFSRLREQFSSRQHEMSWKNVEKNDKFDSSNGLETLTELFDGLSQSIVHQFILGAGGEEGFPNISPCPIILTAPLFI